MKHYPNKDDWDEKFWSHDYKILISAQGIDFRVNADCEQDAIDYVIDYCEERGWNGLVAPWDEIDDPDNTDFICGGNHCLYLTTHNVHIQEI